MPLIKSKSPRAFTANLKAELSAGKPRDQALAIAYSVKRRARAEGGEVDPILPPPRNPARAPEAVENAALDMGIPTREPQPHLDPMDAYQRTAGEVEARNVQSRMNIGPVGRRAITPWSTEDVPLAKQIVRIGDEGVKPKSDGGALQIAYAARRERGGGMHVGSIVSDVPGRTDQHPMDVPAGAYVIPAEAVSNLGENNTLAGLRQLEQMLSGSPQQMRAAFDIGERAMARGGNINDGQRAEPVSIVAAGGEFVIPPEKVAILGWGDVNKGHRNLDAWVMKRRKHHIKTLQKLSPPARD